MAKRPRRPRKRGKGGKGAKPESVVGGLKAGDQVVIDTGKLSQFLKKLKKRKPKVQFVARNAPFMRRSAIPQV